MCAVWLDESFRLFPTSGRVYIWRTPKEAYDSECLIPTVKHGGGSVMVWAAILWYSILLVPLLPFMAELLQGSASHDPDIISEQRCSFPGWQCSPFTQLKLCGSVVVWRAWRWTSTSSLASTITSLDIIESLCSVLEAKVRNRFPPPTSLKQLQDVLQEEWYKILLEAV
jgi:hypothetical protein